MAIVRSVRTMPTPITAQPPHPTSTTTTRTNAKKPHPSTRSTTTFNGLVAHQPELTDGCTAASGWSNGTSSGRSGTTSVWMVVVVMRVTTLKASAAGLGGLLDYYAGLAEDRAAAGPGAGSGRLLPRPRRAAGRWWGDGRGGARPRRRGRRRGPAGAARGPPPRSPAGGWAGGSATRRPGGSTPRSRRRSRCRCCGRCHPDPWVRAEVLAAHDAAVDAALGWLETPRRGHPPGHRRRRTRSTPRA